MHTEVEPKLLDVPSAARALGIGRTLCWQFVRDEELKTIWLGRRRLVPVTAIDDFVNARISMN